MFTEISSRLVQQCDLPSYLELCPHKRKVKQFRPKDKQIQSKNINGDETLQKYTNGKIIKSSRSIYEETREWSTNASILVKYNDENHNQQEEEDNDDDYLIRSRKEDLKLLNKTRTSRNKESPDDVAPKDMAPEDQSDNLNHKICMLVPKDALVNVGHSLSSSNLTKPHHMVTNDRLQDSMGLGVGAKCYPDLCQQSVAKVKIGQVAKFPVLFGEKPSRNYNSVMKNKVLYRTTDQGRRSDVPFLNEDLLLASCSEALALASKSLTNQNDSSSSISISSHPHTDELRNTSTSLTSLSFGHHNFHPIDPYDQLTKTNNRTLSNFGEVSELRAFGCDALIDDNLQTNNNSFTPIKSSMQTNFTPANYSSNNLGDSFSFSSHSSWTNSQDSSSSFLRTSQFWTDFNNDPWDVKKRNSSISSSTGGSDSFDDEEASSKYNDNPGESANSPFAQTITCKKNISRIKRNKQKTAVKTQNLIKQNEANISSNKNKLIHPQTSHSNTDKSRYATRFTADQNNILLEWYSRNQDMPYATDQTINELSIKTQLSEKSVRKWLSNKRSRKNNTNRLSVVVAYKKNKNMI